MTYGGYSTNREKVRKDGGPMKRRQFLVRVVAGLVGFIPAARMLGAAPPAALASNCGCGVLQEQGCAPKAKCTARGYNGDLYGGYALYLYDATSGVCSTTYCGSQRVYQGCCNR